jgi:hypothetical protein
VGFLFDEDEQLPLLYGFGDPIKLCRLILTVRPFSARGPRPSARTRPSSCFGSTFGIKALYSNSVTVFFAGSPATEPTSLVKKLGGSDPRRRRRWAAEKPLSVGSLPPKIRFSPLSIPRLRRRLCASFLGASSCAHGKTGRKSKQKAASGHLLALEASFCAAPSVMSFSCDVLEYMAVHFSHSGKLYGLGAGILQRVSNILVLHTVFLAIPVRVTKD